MNKREWDEQTSSWKRTYGYDCGNDDRYIPIIEMQRPGVFFLFEKKTFRSLKPESQMVSNLSSLSTAGEFIYLFRGKTINLPELSQC